MLVGAAWLAAAAVGYVVFLVIVTVGGILSPFPVTDISSRPPYAGVIGREYTLKSKLVAVAWNDFPDKKKILSITLQPMGHGNRFVSAHVDVQRWQRLRVVGARQQWGFAGIGRWYVVSLPGIELPDAPIGIGMDSARVPDPTLYEPVTDATNQATN